MAYLGKLTTRTPGTSRNCLISRLHFSITPGQTIVSVLPQFYRYDWTSMATKTPPKRACFQLKRKQTKPTRIHSRIIEQIHIQQKRLYSSHYLRGSKNFFRIKKKKARGHDCFSYTVKHPPKFSVVFCF